MGLISPGVWVRRGDGKNQEWDGYPDVVVFECLLSAGEDMSADGRQQLALFLVSSRVGSRGEGPNGGDLI
jgi:hypothetical protein